MKTLPKNLPELLLRLEQMKMNLPHHYHNAEVLSMIGKNYQEHVQLLKSEYRQLELHDEYQSWYEEFRKRRLHRGD